MSYRQYAKLQKYVNGSPTSEYKKGRLIASGLADCSGTGISTIKRWVEVTGEYLCQGYDKYGKWKEQQTSDNIHWTDTGNTKAVGLIETNSWDCGYIPANCYYPEGNMMAGETQEKGNTYRYHFVDYTGNECYLSGTRALPDRTNFDYPFVVNQYFYDCPNQVAFAFKFNTKIGSGATITNMKYKYHFMSCNGITEQTKNDGVLKNFTNVSYSGGSGATIFYNDTYNSNVTKTGNSTYHYEGFCNNAFDSGFYVVFDFDTVNKTVTMPVISYKSTLPYLEKWVLVYDDYLCVGVDKHQKEQKLTSTDGGETWVETGDTRAGALIEENSVDCGGTHNFSMDYLTLEALGSGNIQLFRYNNSGYSNYKPLTDIQYSKNDGEWTNYTYNTNISVVEGDKIRWRANWSRGNTNNYYSRFVVTTLYKVYGNPISLILNDNFTNVTDISNYESAFYQLFEDSQSYISRGLTDASNLALCATTLSDNCYEQMFYGCTQLASAPALPATTLTYGCYQHMFLGCTKLTVAPTLPATTLTEWCYFRMFYNSRQMSYIKCLATNTEATGCLNDWVNSVSSIGTFVKASGSTWSSGTNGIPEGWTVEEVSTT